MRPAGRKHYHVRVGLRSKNQGRHDILYFEDDVEALIINVLHGRMDPLKHLDLPE